MRCLSGLEPELQQSISSAVSYQRGKSGNTQGQFPPQQLQIPPLHLNLLLDNVLIGQATAEMENVSSSSVVLYNKASIKWFWAISRFSIFGGLGQSPSIYEKLKQIHASLQKYHRPKSVLKRLFKRILPFFVVPLSPKFEHPNHRIIQVANWWCIAIPEIQNHPVVSSFSPFHPQKTGHSVNSHSQQSSWDKWFYHFYLHIWNFQKSSGIH